MGWEEFVMKTTILVYVIALGGVAMIALGLWGLYILLVAELRLRDPGLLLSATACQGSK